MNTKLRYLKLILIASLFLVIGLQALGQNGTKTLHIRKTETPPQIDGRLDDACWQGIEPVSGFFQGKKCSVRANV